MVAPLISFGRNAVCVLAFAFGLGAAAKAEEAPFPGYDELCGYPIVHIPNLTISQAVVEPTGEKVIVLDPSLQTPQEAAQRQFLIAHECAHHRMEHAGIASRQARVVSRRLVRDQELSADCWAAETLAARGLERTIRIMADRFFKAGLYSPGGGYPAGVQRSTIIMHCAEKGRESASADLQADGITAE